MLQWEKKKKKKPGGSGEAVISKILKVIKFCNSKVKILIGFHRCYIWYSINSITVDLVSVERDLLLRGSSIYHSFMSRASIN